MHEKDSIAVAIGAVVDDRKLPGAVALVWREGKGAQVTCVGWRDMAAGLPICGYHLPHCVDDEADHLDGGAEVARRGPVPPRRPDHTLGARVCRDAGPAFAHGAAGPDGPCRTSNYLCGPADAPVRHRLWRRPSRSPRQGLCRTRWAAISTARWRPTRGSHGLGTLPLIDRPARRLHYGHSTDLLGLVIARMEDAPLGDVLARRIFGPLGMHDTGFTVPKVKAGRRAKLYGFDDEGRLVERLTAPGNSTMPERPEGCLRLRRPGPVVDGGHYLAFARCHRRGCG